MTELSPSADPPRFSLKYRFRIDEPFGPRFTLPRVTRAVGALAQLACTPSIRNAVLTRDGVRVDLKSVSFGIKLRLIAGIYEEFERRACMQAVVPSDVVLELGAGVGYIASLCIQRGATVIATTEPSSTMRACTQRTFSLNNVTTPIFPYAIAANEGVVRFHVEKNPLASRVNGTSNSYYDVKAVTLPSLFAQLPQSPTVIIADIEGAEKQIDWKTLPESVRLLIVEFHPCFSVQDAVATWNAIITAGFSPQLRMKADTVVVFKRD